MVWSKTWRPCRALALMKKWSSRKTPTGKTPLNECSLRSTKARRSRADDALGFCAADDRDTLTRRPYLRAAERGRFATGRGCYGNDGPPSSSAVQSRGAVEPRRGKRLSTLVVALFVAILA